MTALFRRLSGKGYPADQCGKLRKNKQNETLKDIALKFNTTEELLKNYNDLKNDVDFGDVILINEKNKALYIVKPLDNLDSISKKFMVSTQEIIRKNNLATTKLFIGQKLII